MNLDLETMAVDSRASFAHFLSLLRQELDSTPELWSNNSLPAFLEAIESYALDIDGFYLNTNQVVDANVPSWQNFANILRGARMYE
ncbi:hypothetical protein [Hymenobacter sp. BT559]|uniref:DUF7660 family protein n=1 Tax=Hymenobacter sp. BT559 TaxID=2795729 RepID=UPI0018EB4D02|nr:hypothetical protein [Hymenobacter sp. BT559]